MFSMKCKGADSGEFSGAGAVCNVHYVLCAVCMCCLLPAKDEDLAVERGCIQ